VRFTVPTHGFMVSTG